MKSLIVKFAVALASVAMLALFMWGFADACDEEMESHSKEYWERMEEERWHKRRYRSSESTSET